MVQLSVNETKHRPKMQPSAPYATLAWPTAQVNDPFTPQSW